MRPKISIIVPCYNVEKYLERCVKSLTCQTFKDIEIILVDDKSPDIVPEMCDQWAKMDSRIKVIHKTDNEGLGYARNTGIDQASGQYLAFVDSDDFVKPNIYEVLYQKAIDHNADVVYCNCSFYKSEGNEKQRYDVDKECIFEGREAVDNFLLDMIGPAPESPRSIKYMVSVWHGIYRRDIFEKNSIRFVSERELVSEDIIFDIDFLCKCNKIIYVPDILCMYCLNENSLSHTINDSKYLKRKEFIVAVDHRLKKIYPSATYMIHLQRYCIFAYLSIIKNAVQKKYQKLTYSDILMDPFWHNILKGYPISRMTLKYRFVLYLCMHRYLWPLLRLVFSAL